ncbi:hypothetical protein Slin14017_G034360 [Septoria linicola]|nr:hypothetical protein Slin14017_G034360 [Septoria linicola]
MAPPNEAWFSSIQCSKKPKSLNNNYDLPHPSDSDAPKTDEGEFFLMQHSEQPLTSVDIKTQFIYDPVESVLARDAER